jgi:hypothetical protein
MRGTVTITEMIWFNLGDAGPSIVPSVSRALCRAIHLQFLLGRVLPAVASHFPSAGLVLILSTPNGRKAKSTSGVTRFEPTSIVFGIIQRQPC